jgi:hypothetical protein
MADYLLVIIPKWRTKMDGQGTEHKSVISIVSGWFKSGLVEISCSSKVGHIRLMLTRLKNDRNKVAQKLGLEVFSLLEKGELKIPGVDNLFLELRQINKTIMVREAEIEQILKDKEIRLLEASGESVTPTSPTRPPQAKPARPAAKKAAVRKKAAAPVKRKSAAKKAATKKAGTATAEKKTSAAAGKKKTAVKRRATVKKKPTAKKAAPAPKPAETTAAPAEKKEEKKA